MRMYYALIEPLGSKICDGDYSCREQVKEAYIVYLQGENRIWVYNRCTHHLRTERDDEITVQIRFLLKIIKKDFLKRGEKFVVSIDGRLSYVSDVIKIMEDILK